MSVGYSFAPTFDQAELGKRGGVPPTRPQSSLQTLNYSLPSQTSAHAISPKVGNNQLGSSISSAVLQHVLQTVLGSDAGASSGNDGTSDSGFGATADTGLDQIRGMTNDPGPLRSPDVHISADSDGRSSNGAIPSSDGAPSPGDDPLTARAPSFQSY